MTQVESSAWQKALQDSYSQTEDGAQRTGTIKNSRSARVQYWRKPNGWITTGPTIQNAPKFQQMIEIKGCQSIPADRFGAEFVGSQYIQPSSPKLSQQAGPDGDIVPGWLIPFFNTGGHKYICSEKDYNFGTPGEYLMPRAQIITLNLHRREWMKKDRPDVVIEDIPCPYHCQAMVGRGPRLFTSEDAVSQHIVAVHREAVPSQAMANAISAAMKEQNADRGDVDIKVITASVVAALKAAGVADPKLVAEAEKAANPYPPGPPDETWTRGQLMKYASEKGMYPERSLNPLRWGRAEWCEYIQKESDWTGTPVPETPKSDVDEIVESLEGTDS